MRREATRLQSPLHSGFVHNLIRNMASEYGRGEHHEPLRFGAGAGGPSVHFWQDDDEITPHSALYDFQSPVCDFISH